MERALDRNGALDRIERVAELDKECVSDRFDLSSSVPLEQGSNYQAMLLKKEQGLRFVLLHECAIPHHVSEHDGCQPSCGRQFFAPHIPLIHIR